MRWLLSRLGWMIAGIASLYALSMLAGVASGGPLDPPGLPAPTMKTLADVAPSWHQKLVSTNGDVNGCNSARFTCVLDGEAVLDNETGLVWDRNPDIEQTQTWNGAFGYCTNRELGGRGGFRLPSVEEMNSLRDDSADRLPDGGPFTVPTEQQFWTASTEVGNAAWAYTFQVNNSGASASEKTGATAVWCVRGPAAAAIPNP